MTNQSEARRLFAEMVSKQEEEINLAEAVLLMAKKIEYPDLRIDEYLRRIEVIGNKIKGRIGDKTDPYALIYEINEYLFAEKGFMGNENDYYDPRNSFLNDVLDRKTGIPITLSVLYMEVAGRAGLPVSGIGFPGHFIVKYSDREHEILIDPFNKGRIISEEDCKDILNRIYGEGAQIQEEFLQPFTKKQILTRMLYNLKGIYLSSKNYPEALSVTDMILAVNPGSMNEMRDRGLLYYHLECFVQALSDLETYLRHVPDGADTEAIKSYILVLKDLAGKIS